MTTGLAQAQQREATIISNRNYVMSKLRAAESMVAYYVKQLDDIDAALAQARDERERAELPLLVSRVDDVNAPIPYWPWGRV